MLRECKKSLSAYVEDFEAWSGMGRIQERREGMLSLLVLGWEMRMDRL